MCQMFLKKKFSNLTWRRHISLINWQSLYQSWHEFGDYAPTYLSLFFSLPEMEHKDYIVCPSLSILMLNILWNSEKVPEK